MSAISLKPVEHIDRNQVLDLTNLLNNDEKLCESLGSQKNTISFEDFVSSNIQWCKDNNAKLFAIMLKNKAIGTISLSHINTKDQTARCGYSNCI